MKYPLMAFICVAQLFQGSAAWASIGSTADIAKYSHNKTLRISGSTFYTTEIQKLYALRSNRSVWFNNGVSNGKLDAYFQFIQSVANPGPGNLETWVPIASSYSQGIDEATWITLELVATESIIVYMNSLGIYDYSNLNKALSGSVANFINYLSGLNPTTPTIPPVVTDPNAGPVLTANDPLIPAEPTLADTPIAFSNAKYANDPSPAAFDSFAALTSDPLFTTAAGQPNEMANALKDTLRSASRHGLNPNDYWGQDLENSYQTALAGQGAEFEVKAKRAVLRYAFHLTGGRLNPQAIDAKLLKFQPPQFTDNAGLVALLKGNATGLKMGLELYAPQTPQYKQVVSTLVRLQNLKQQNLWRRFGAPVQPLRRGDSSGIVVALRQQLMNLGYLRVAGNTYDANLDAAIKSYIQSNGLSKMDSRFWNSFAPTVDARIQQVSVNLEKLRWIPRDSRPRFAVVNLAAQEIRLYDQGLTKMKFRTVNGRQDRPTTSMLQQARSIILNPTWTVPPTLAVKDKLPMIRQNPNYMIEHNMYILDAHTGQYITDMSLVDLNLITGDDQTRYYFVQGPGNQNALGVLKFPLQNMDGTLNSDDIYMHDTNERELFVETNRYRSSGCVRLQYPLEFAAELLKDKGMTIDDIKAKVPWDNPDQEVSLDQTNQYINLPKPLTVYLIYLTSDMTDDGAVRLFEDTYGLDAKIVVGLKSSI